MNKRGLFARTAAGALGGMLLLGGAGAAIADEVENDDVQVGVEIEAIEPVGALTMSVAANSTTLEEVASGDPEIRQFDGVLPTVTVTDDREELPATLGWYVTGQTSDFTGTNVPAISKGHLGWEPRLVTPADEGEVVAGDEVVTVLDEATQAPGTPSANNTGVVAEELLAMVLDPEAVHAVGSWQVAADLFLKTPVDVEPGSYSSTLTLTLWEDEL